jgi:hypothetical protein
VIVGIDPSLTNTADVVDKDNYEFKEFTSKNRGSDLKDRLNRYRTIAYGIRDYLDQFNHEIDLM